VRTSLIFAMVVTSAFNLAATPVQPAATWTEAGRFQVNIPITGEPNVSTVQGVLSKPQGNGPFAAIVMFRGISGFAVHLANLTRHADHYNGMGIIALALDPAGSRGYRPGSSPPAAALRRDAYAALSYLRGTALVDQQKIFVEGISRGGGIVLAALDSNQNNDQQQRFAGGIAYVPWCYPTLTPYAPLIIFSGGNDWISAAKACEQLRGRSNLEVMVFPNAAHEFASSDGDDARIAQRQVDAFITRIIGGNAPTASSR
jgi:dienelactone hydrolase